MVRSTLLMTALVLAGCGRQTAGTPPKLAIVRPELAVNLKEQVGREVEVTGLLVGVSAEANKEQGKWVGDATVALECKGMKLTCQFPRVTSVPVRFLPGVSGSHIRLLTVRGTVASVKPEGPRP